MSGLPEFLLTPFGQGRKQQGRQDYDNNYREQYKGGEIERDGVETFFDNLLRGGSDQVQSAAQQRHIDRLEGTNSGTYLLDNRDKVITKNDTDKGLRRDALKGKREDEAIAALRAAQYTGDVNKLKGLGADAIYAMVPGQLRDTKKENYKTDPVIQEALARREIEDRRYYDDKREARKEKQELRLERLENQRSEIELRRDNMNLEYARLSQADKYKAQDRKDKAVMMLLQGLGNLGAGFTI
jgi:hypothetical protein